MNQNPDRRRPDSSGRRRRTQRDSGTPVNTPAPTEPRQTISPRVLWSVVGAGTAVTAAIVLVLFSWLGGDAPAEPAGSDSSISDSDKPRSPTNSGKSARVNTSAATPHQDEVEVVLSQPRLLWSETERKLRFSVVYEFPRTPPREDCWYSFEVRLSPRTTLVALHPGSALNPKGVMRNAANFPAHTLLSDSAEFRVQRKSTNPEDGRSQIVSKPIVFKYNSRIPHRLDSEVFSASHLTALIPNGDKSYLSQRIRIKGKAIETTKAGGVTIDGSFSRDVLCVFAAGSKPRILPGDDVQIEGTIGVSSKEFVTLTDCRVMKGL